MLSYWENKNFLNYDLIVIGSGFVGLSTAIHYKKKHPKSHVVVVERGIFPSGASSKNAGFACFGSLTEILDDFLYMSTDEVIGLVKRRYQGLKQIRKTFGDKAINYQSTKGFELLDARLLPAYDQIGEVNRLLKSIFKEDVFSKVKKHERLGFTNQVEMIIQNKFEGELDPGKYLKCLWKEAGKLGIRILNGVNVKEVDPETGTIKVEQNWNQSEFDLQAKELAICTNAFAKNLIPNLSLEPGRGLVMVSEPLDFKIPWKGGFHMDQGYVYFRKVDGRLLLGGARNMDRENENSQKFEINPKIRSYLDRISKEVIFPGKEFRWEMEWTGIMAFGEKKMPIIQEVGKKASVAVRLGGMGVAIGWQVGKELADLISKK